MDIHGGKARGFLYSFDGNKFASGRLNKAGTSLDGVFSQRELSPFNYTKHLLSNRLSNIYEEVAREYVAPPEQQNIWKEPGPEKLKQALQHFLENSGETHQGRLGERRETPRERLEERRETARERLEERRETARERLEERRETARERLEERFETPWERLEERRETPRERLEERRETARGRLEEHTEMPRETLEERFDKPRERLEERTGKPGEKFDQLFETAKEKLEPHLEKAGEKLDERSVARNMQRNEHSELAREKFNARSDETRGAAREQTDIRRESISMLFETLHDEPGERKICPDATGIKAALSLKFQDMLEYIPKETRKLLQSCLSRCLLEYVLSSEVEEAQQRPGASPGEESPHEIRQYIREICSAGIDAEDIFVHLENVWNMLDNKGIMQAFQTFLSQRMSYSLLIQILAQALNFSKYHGLGSRDTESDEKQAQLSKDGKRAFIIKAVDESTQDEERRKGKKRYQKTASPENDEPDSTEDHQNGKMEFEFEKPHFPLMFFHINTAVLDAYSVRINFNMDENETQAGSSPSTLLWYYMYLFYERLFSRGLPYAQFTSAYTESTVEDRTPVEKDSSRGFFWFMRKSSPGVEAIAEQIQPELFTRKLRTLAEEKMNHDYMTLFDEDFRELSHEELKSDPEYRELFELLNS